jgi:hypothetical protein
MIMSWIDELRDEMRRQGDPWGDGTLMPQSFEEAEVRTGALVRAMLEQMNDLLLEGRGSVWDSSTSFGGHLWELWWERKRDHGRHLVVTLLRDSRGTPYLKVQGRRLPLQDGETMRRRLQRALRTAFLQPRSYTPRFRQQWEIAEESSSARR